MIGATIHHSATVVISLVDTASGKEVASPETKFTKTVDGKTTLLNLLHKDGGYFLLMNEEKKDFLLTVKAKGYEPIEKQICFEDITELDPVVGVYLTPLAESMNDSLITLHGQVKGLKEISALNLDGILAHGERYDKRRQTIITFESEYRLSSNVSPFGILSPESDSYEVVFVDRLPRPNEARLQKPLEGELVRNSSFIRLQYGQIVSPDGDFIFRVYNRGRPLKFLFRVVTEDGVTFKELDLKNMEDEEWYLK